MLHCIASLHFPIKHFPFSKLTVPVWIAFLCVGKNPNVWGIDH